MALYLIHLPKSLIELFVILKLLWLLDLQFVVFSFKLHCSKLDHKETIHINQMGQNINFKEVSNISYKFYINKDYLLYTISNFGLSIQYKFYLLDKYYLDN